MEDLTKHYLISGRVQGVGYRAFTQRTAGEMSLQGWVRNLFDGRVEAVARASDARLRRFEARLRQGPPRAVVEAIVVREWSEPTLAASFEVRKDGEKPCCEI